MLIVSKLNRLIGNWNHPDSKACLCINCPNHKYITELEDMLVLFWDWKKEATTAKNPWACFSPEIYNNLCWIMYGLKGVAKLYLEDGKKWEMVQSRGGTVIFGNTPNFSLNREYIFPRNIILVLKAFLNICGMVHFFNSFPGRLIVCDKYGINDAV